MFKIRNFKQEGFADNGKIYGVVEASVSEASELVASTDVYEFTQGSIAWDISTGDFYGLDSSGSWIKQGDSE